MEPYSPDMKNKGTYVLCETVINGNIRSDKDVYLEGRVMGNIHCKADVIVSETAEVSGDVCCENLFIAGLIKGNAEVSGKACLEGSAVIKGYLFTSCLKLYPTSVIEKGLRLQDKKTNDIWVKK